MKAYKIALILSRGETRCLSTHFLFCGGEWKIAGRGVVCYGQWSMCGQHLEVSPLLYQMVPDTLTGIDRLSDKFL